MYAPSHTGKWHKVHPLDLTRAVCSAVRIYRTDTITEELPEGADYCAVCERRSHFVEASEPPAQRP